MDSITKPEFAPPSSLDGATRLRALAELLRIPNVFTAAADILLGYLFTHRELSPWPLVAMLIGGSALIYSAGMALNDYFDRSLDAHERPSRPIPSGRVSAATARNLGFGFLIGGVALACGAAAFAGQPRPALVAVSLAALVVLYTAALKNTPLAPLGMGGCRALNVLLGMSVMAGPWQQVNYVVAGGVGVYIAGVTWFARAEATESSRVSLAAATVVMLAGLALLAFMPEWVSVPAGAPEIRIPDRWYMFWILIAAMLGWRCGLAVWSPEPEVVQSAVRNCIFSLIIIDAGACSAAQDFLHAIYIIVLLIPTMFLGRFVYST
jgi:4-hydroxybenzoate polyprenyltransferase